MYLYAGLYVSMLTWCDLAGMRHVPLYTLSMLGMGLGICLNVISLIAVLWLLGLVPDAYTEVTQLNPPHYLVGALCVAWIANSLMARVTIRANRGRMQGQLLPRFSTSAVAAPVYLLVSAALFALALVSAASRI